MVDVIPPVASELRGAPLFYSKPEPLNPAVHGGIGLRRVDRPFAFAAASHFVPLTVVEFQQAALSYPIIFAGDQRQPLAMMGVNAGQNMWVRDGMFEPGAYIPAYVRRYPFVLAADDKREKLVVCIDRAAPMIGDLPDLALFDAEGQPTDYTKNCINFCNDFETEVRRTESFVTLMKDLDLFETRTANYTPANSDGSPGPTQLVAEFFAISEDKLKGLPEAKIHELFNNGALMAIHAHLISLNGWDRLIGKTLASAARPAAANVN